MDSLQHDYGPAESTKHSVNDFFGPTPARSQLSGPKYPKSRRNPTSTGGRCAIDQPKAIDFEAATLPSAVGFALLGAWIAAGPPWASSDDNPCFAMKSRNARSFGEK